MKQIICIKWGTRYGSGYVNRIYAMVQRNIAWPICAKSLLTLFLAPRLRKLLV